jgi:hypothetical protein
VILTERVSAIMIPEQSVVLRPAGQVVYVVKDNIAHQAIVTTGLRKNGLVEVTDGISVNDVVAVDGAGFLTDQAEVKIASKP